VIFRNLLTDADPLQTFHEWVEGDEVALATATPDGRPSVRMVLLKGADERGFTFFTNYESRKGRELASNPHAALLFHRPGIQVRVEGPVERLPPGESDAYWATRPSGSRRSAAASRQSQPIASRAALEAAVAAQPPEPPRPAHWGGFRLRPETYEFWRHRDDRLHDRHLFRRRGDAWEVLLLQP
jgi:pyridoxamine 5'-phosphate oxidase